MYNSKNIPVEIGLGSLTTQTTQQNFNYSVILTEKDFNITESKPISYQGKFDIIELKPISYITNA